MRIGLISQFYAPEPGPASLPATLARGLVDRGHQVRVLTAVPSYPHGRVAPPFRNRLRQREDRDGVQICRVGVLPSHDRSTARRLAWYGSFGVTATAASGFLRDADALWLSYSPLTAGWPAALLHRRWGVPVVTHVLDLWPDTVLHSGFQVPGAGLAEAAMHRWADGIYAMSSAVAYISPSVGDILRGRGVPGSRLHYVPMWSNDETAVPAGEGYRQRLGIGPDTVMVVYAGALGRAQAIDLLADAALPLQDKDLVCVIAGSGTEEDALRERVESRGQRNVRLIGRLPSSEMPALLGAADAAYIGLAAHEASAYTFPSKTQAYLAAGRPVVACADGDVARVVRDSGAGWVTPAGDRQGLTEVLSGLCDLGRHGIAPRGEQGRRHYETHFSQGAATGRIEELLAGAASQAQRGRPNP